MSRVWISLSLVALIAAAILAGRAATRPEPVNVIVLTVESWRADTVTAERMPALASAAREGVTFTNHRAVSAWTAPNVVAVLTGVSPFEQGIHARGQSLPELFRTLPEILADRGWHVGGVQAFMLIDVFQNLGITYEPGSELFSWIAQRARRADPFFLWYHYLDTHLPYDPGAADAILSAYPESTPGENDRRAQVRALPAIPEGELDWQQSDRPWVEALYRGGFSDFDSWFSQFWAFFEASGLKRNTILIVTADHGEELLERGNVGHASTTRAGHLHEEVVHVPLFVWAPPELLPVAAGTTVEDMTDHLMIAPTLADLLSVDTPTDLESAGLFDAPHPVRWMGLTSRAGFSEPDPARIERYYAAAIEGDAKVQIAIEDGKAPVIEAWDLETDPGETSPIENVPERHRALADALAERLSTVRFAPGSSEAAERHGSSAKPGWLHPDESQAVGYADIADRTFLAWTGDPTSDYVIEYEAGSGLLALGGTFDVAGTRHDFGPVEEGYWRTWVVPYDRIRFRVRPAGTPDAWSEWIELELQP